MSKTSNLHIIKIGERFGETFTQRAIRQNNKLDLALFAKYCLDCENILTTHKETIDKHCQSCATARQEQADLER